MTAIPFAELAMPLLDHFHPPLSRTHPWRGFHGAWAAAMARLLNAGVLPPGYYAVPFLDRDGPFVIDESEAPGGVQPRTTLVPGQAVAVEWPGTDGVRLEVLADEGGPRLAAAVELVSPRNKDRARAREAFAAKCADYLRRGCGLVVVDVVTTRRADLHADLLSELGADAAAGSGGLSVVSYRSVGRESEGRLESWPEVLEVGRPLPTVPLWLAGEAAVPLDLEASHTAACVDLRIRQGELRIVTSTLPAPCRARRRRSSVSGSRRCPRRCGRRARRSGASPGGTADSSPCRPILAPSDRPRP